MLSLRFLLKVGVLGLAVVATAGAYSAERAKGASGLWLLAKYDTNGDHEISVTEIGKKREKMFVHMDNDQDGSVSFNEYQVLDTKRRQLILKARFNKLDLDQDGHVDTQEYSSYIGSFDRFDHNGDGKITSKEMGKKRMVKQAAKGGATHCLLWLCVRSSL